jgi:hypothetical protein
LAAGLPFQLRWYPSGNLAKPRPAIIVPVANSNRELVLRFVELFNHDMAEGATGVSNEMRDLFVSEPVIVPLRAYLEDIEYSGPTALEDFTAGSAETWRRVQIEPGEIRELDGEHVLMVGTLVGTGRESGAKTEQPCAWLIEFRDGRIAEGRTYLSEREALQAAAQ